MINNYFTLNRAVLELNNTLKGKFLTGIFTQSKNRLLFEFHNEDGDFLSLLEICVTPGNAYICIKSSSKIAKRNVLSFFKDELPSILNSAAIAVNDRIFLLDFTAIKVFFAIRGKFTNVYFMESDGNLTSFKECDSDILSDFKADISNLVFTSYLNRLESYTENMFINLLDLRKQIPLISKELISYLENKGNIKSIDDVINVIEQFSTCSFHVFRNNQNTLEFTPAFLTPINTEIQKKSDSVLELIDYFVTLTNSEIIFEKLKRDLKKQIESKTGFLEGKIKNLSERVLKGSNSEKYKKYGNLLLSFKYMLKNHEDTATLIDYETDSEITIPLNKKLTVAENAAYYFKKSKSDESEFSKLPEIIDSTKKELQKNLKLNEEFDLLQDLNDLINFAKSNRLRIDKTISKKEPEQGIRLRKYDIGQGYTVIVGKDNKSNDYLTLKIASNHDIWLHAKDTAGSHTVLKVKNKTDSPPKEILEKAACIAAFHSKSKSFSLCPVTYTLKKYIVKRKGFPPGKVSVLKEEVIIVEPGIPEDAKILLQN